MKHRLKRHSMTHLHRYQPPKKATCMSVIQSSLLVAAIVFAFFLKNIKVDSFFFVCIYVNYFEMQMRCLDAV